jgi:hypothetical protein
LTSDQGIRQRQASGFFDAVRPEEKNTNQILITGGRASVGQFSRFLQISQILQVIFL